MNCYRSGVVFPYESSSVLVIISLRLRTDTNPYNPPRLNQVGKEEVRSIVDCRKWTV